MIRDLWRRLIVAVDNWLHRQINARATDTTRAGGVAYRIRRYEPRPTWDITYKPRPYDESADEIGGRRDYYDGLGD